MSTKGALIAAVAAGLFSAGAPLLASAADSAKVHCEGVNSCKGKGSCHSAANSCAGKNGCKGKGWMEMSEKDCKDKGGKVTQAGK
ncbi:MAG TPA: hypothetical protein VHL80_12550 [Polyangia bacterium]|jgi:hypothetical protein|nr:hypothetical protein [Polyangia bacterium]